MSKHTGKSLSEISEALERDNFMTADEAKKFGLMKSVVEKNENNLQYIEFVCNFSLISKSYTTILKILIRYVR